MKKNIYDKLVRDKIPEIVEKSGKQCEIEILSDEKYLEMIDKKLDEELAEYNTFKSIWNDVSIGKFADSVKDFDAHVICGSIQSVALNIDFFKDNDFDYIIIDEAHHATADTYQKVLAYFKPKFILGLTATPERADDTNILEIFKNTVHKLDIVLNIGDVFMEVVHEYPDITVHLTLFNATIDEGVPQKLEHNDIKWITPAEIPNFDFCPADKEILEKIRNRL